MKILFCKEWFSEGLPWQGLSSFLPGHTIVACSRDRDDILAHLEGVDILVPWWAPIGREIIEQGTFGLIHQFGVGLDAIDIAAATEHGTWVTRLPAEGTSNADAVAEHAIFLMLALSRRFAETQQIMQIGHATGKWGQPAGFGLLGKTACIVGLGDIGTAVARRLAPFGMQLIGVRQNPARGASAGTNLHKIYGTDQLDEALSVADYVVICVNYSQHNHHMFNTNTFSAMKDGAFLVNIARGGLIDQDALLDALEHGQVAGAGLDVFWQEPVDPEHPLFKQNVIATPHIAGVTDIFYYQGARLFAENVERYVRGEMLRNIINAPTNPRHPLAARQKA